MILQIPDMEYQSRLAKFQLLLKENNFDAALVFSNEQDYTNVNSDYVLEPHMTFQIDTFLKSNTFGLRWENGIVVTDNGIEFLSDKHMQIIEII